MTPLVEFRPVVRIYLGWFNLALFPRWRAGWFRIFGLGLGLVDHRINPAMFSERYNRKHGLRRRIFIHVGPWCVRVFTRTDWS